MLLHRGRVLLRLASAPTAVALALGALATAPPAGATTPAPSRFELRDESRTLVSEAGYVRVTIHLETQTVLRGALARRLPTVPVSIADSSRAGVARFESTRAARLHDLNALTGPVERQQALLREVIESHGGDVVRHDVVVNTVDALVPRGAIPVLRGRPEVRALTRATVLRELGIEISSAAIGAPAFWAAGHLGGGGPADGNPADLAIVSDKIEEDHPAFADIDFQRPSDVSRNTHCGQAVSGCEHGTEVASMAISRGASGCTLCSPSDAVQKGGAPHVETVLDADSRVAGLDDSAWALGIGSFGIVGPADPAEVLSVSRGNRSLQDDSSFLQGTDKLISTFGTLMAWPSGNEGPAQTINDACTAYDTLCMGAFDHRGTVGPADDVIPDFSSRGPTPGGRKKPDLVAVGVSVFANQHWIRDGNLWAWGEGTSLAAPQGAAAAALLAGSGVTSHLAQKAILIDSARQGRANPSSPMGTQTGWQADWGWGAVNLEAALTELSNYELGTVAGGEAQFYRATTASAGDRATLVWDRRAVGCFRPGCGSTALTLTNLELEQIDPASGTVEARSASAIDNVEQVRSPSTGEVIYKVTAATAVDGLPGEPYALAARRQLTPLTAPRPSVRATLSRAAARPGDDVHVVAEIANPSPDLSAENASATIELPPGVELAPGSPPARQELGTLTASAASPRTVTWTVRASSDGLHRVRVSSSATRYEETFASADDATVAFDGTPPSVVLSAPAGEVVDPRIPVTWTAADAGVGVADYDVEVSVDGAAFEPWLSATALTSGTYPGVAGRTYRFRARARDALRSVSAYVASDSVRVSAPSTFGPPVPPLPPPGAVKPISPRLRVTSVKRRGRYIHLSGRIEKSAAGSIALRASFRGRRGRLLLTATAKPRGGRFSARLRVGRPASGTVTLRYAGEAALSAQAVRVRVRGV